MEEKIISAIDDLALIKDTMENSKTDYHGAYSICFMLGCYYTLLFFAGLASVFHPTLINMYVIAVPILTLLLFVGYLFIYRSERNYTNKYYLGLLNTWGIFVITIPVLTTAVQIIDKNIYGRSNSAQPAILFQIQQFSEVLLFSIFLIISSYIIGRKFLRLVSVFLLFTYLLLITCFTDAGIPLRLPASENASLNIVSIFYFFTICIGYILLGLFLREKTHENK